jgi:prepilin-type N-terminal cleavage/methylation domain-containing protein
MKTLSNRNGSVLRNGENSRPGCYLARPATNLTFGRSCKCKHNYHKEANDEASLAAPEAGALPNAFTLIELLVVIAVIGILAGLLLPTLSSAKLKARQIQCVNNLKQMAVANTMYMHDFRGNCLPYDITGKGLLWMGKLIDYQSKVDVVRLCPVAADIDESSTNSMRWGTADRAWNWHSADPEKDWAGSYTFNGWLYSNLENKTGKMLPEDEVNVFTKDFAVQHPSQTPLFADSVWLDCWPRTNDAPALNLYNGYHGGGFDGRIGRLTIPRHGGFHAGSAPRTFDPEQMLPGAINVACFDGHIELSKLENLWSYYWNRNWQPPNPRPD